MIPRRFHKIIFLGISIVLLIICTVCVVDDEPHASFMKDAADKYNITSVHAVLLTNSGDYTKEDSQYARDQSVYCIGSISKTFVAVLALMLQEEEKIDIDKKVSTYLPELYLGSKSSVTIKDLLKMRSGIADYTSDFDTEDYFEHHDTKDLIDKAVSNSTFTNQGEFLYSNTNILIAELLIEKVTNQSCEQLIREKILEPIGLNNTFFAYEKASIESSIVPGYSCTTLRENVDFTNTTTSWSGMACGMYSTVDDMAVWAQALANKELLTAQSYELLFDFAPSKEDFGYGVCFMQKDINGRNMILANGNVPGYNTTIAFDDEITAVVLCNMSDYSGSNLSYSEIMLDLLCANHK